MRCEVMLRPGVLLLAVGLSGCASTRAATPVTRPALEVPPAPPRVVEPAPLPEVERIEPIEDLPAAPPPAASAKPRPSTPRESKEAQKPEVKPEAPPPVPDQAPPLPPAPVLRTPATANAAAAEKQIRETLSRAQGMLGGVDYQRLSPDRKKAYGEARDFISSAEARIKASNFELAKEYADKAEKLAKELQVR